MHGVWCDAAHSWCSLCGDCLHVHELIDSNVFPCCTVNNYVDPECCWFLVGLTTCWSCYSPSHYSIHLITSFLKSFESSYGAVARPGVGGSDRQLWWNPSCKHLAYCNLLGYFLIIAPRADTEVEEGIGYIRKMGMEEICALANVSIASGGARNSIKYGSQGMIKQPQAG